MMHHRGRGRGRGRGPARQKLEIAGPATPFKTIAVRRPPDHGTAGKPLAIHVNAFIMSVPTYTVHHYDVTIEPKVSVDQNFDIIQAIQRMIVAEIDLAPSMPLWVYDGKKNLYARNPLPFGDDDSREFKVPDPQYQGAERRPPGIFYVRIKKAQTIDLSVLHNFTKGEQQQNAEVSTGLTVLNVIIKMAPIMKKHPFNIRSFFTPEGSRAIGSGLVVWRGYFQSVRPVLDRILVNVDISTGLMYKPGPLIGLCLEFLGWQANRARDLSPTVLGTRRSHLQNFLARMKIKTLHTNRIYTVHKLTRESAEQVQFPKGGKMISVTEYFRSLNYKLKFPGIVCVDAGKGGSIPLEMCTVLAGQLTRKQIPPEKMPDVLSFSSAKPQQRLQSIDAGFKTLSYDTSPYMEAFNLNVQTDKDNAPLLLPIQARVLPSPELRYGAAGKQRTFFPKNGKWNMIGKQLYKPATIKTWAMVIYESTGRFNDDAVKDMIAKILQGCLSLGIKIAEGAPPVFRENGQGNIKQQFLRIGQEVKTDRGEYPVILFIVLPEGGDDIYTQIKHYGDIKFGVATQCLKAQNCSFAEKPFWANVLLKVNVKLGGINQVPVATTLSDPLNPTIVMGADVMDTPPGARDRPAFSSVVSSIDPECSKYVAYMSVQPPHQQIIEDLYGMCKQALEDYKDYNIKALKKTQPTLNRIIFYRDGVSEGEYEQVLEKELPHLKRACSELGFTPKITWIIVGKRHHIRFFPQLAKDGDKKSGNCPAGTVVDRDICHPTDFDYYLLSHGGFKGTSRPAHYVVLHDENQFTADSIEAISFSLCHVYARATRSVSIPAPVYYADIVCSRGRIHFDPNGTLTHDQPRSEPEGQPDVERMMTVYKEAFMRTDDKQRRRMYFM